MSDCRQVAYIHFQRRGASNGYPGLLVVYVLAPWTRSCELSLLALTDGHHQVTPIPDRSRDNS
jgi:hypothetical protein